MYWPEDNESMTFGHTTVSYRGVEVKGDITKITLETERFRKVTTTISH